jgi:putative SbcD/Mre11-related phosphoesterase
VKEILFANGEPAAIVRAGSKRYLVVGDLHIGRELKLAGKGIRIYGTSDLMADRIITLMKRNKTKRLVLLGDVKDSIIRPDSVEMRIIQSFFRKLSSYEITLVQGNHDAGLGDIPNVAVTKEFIAGNIGMIHGNSLPSDELMRCDYIIAGHDHPAVTVGHDYDAHLEKTWVVMSISARNASKTYEMPNRKAKLVIMPAFNDLITGSDVAGDRIINPLVRRGIFKKSGARLFSLTGQPFALPD